MKSFLFFTYGYNNRYTVSFRFVFNFSFAQVYLSDFSIPGKTFILRRKNQRSFLFAENNINKLMHNLQDFSLNRQNVRTMVYL